MLNGLFDMDKPFWRWMGKIPDIIGLSLCWYICCLPLITFIPASCALFDSVSRTIMMDDTGCYKRFFRTFVKELKQGIPLSIFWIVIAAISLIGTLILSQMQAKDTFFSVFSAFYLVSIVMMIPYLGWLVALQSRYHNSFIGLHINTFRFFVGRLWGTLAILLITVAVVIICLLHPITYALLVAAPALITILHTIPIERGFRKAFPNDYEDGLPVYTEQDRIAIRAIKKAKQEEAENAASEEN